MKKILLSLLILSFITSCDKEKKEVLNEEYSVVFLFEIDGIRVYRFSYEGRYHYFTSKGEAIGTYSTSKWVGKQFITNYHDENI